ATTPIRRPVWEPALHFRQFLRSQLALSLVEYARRLESILTSTNLAFQLTENFYQSAHSMPRLAVPPNGFPFFSCLQTYNKLTLKRALAEHGGGRCRSARGAMISSSGNHNGPSSLEK